MAHLCSLQRFCTYSLSTRDRFAAMPYYIRAICQKYPLYFNQIACSRLTVATELE